MGAESSSRGAGRSAARRRSTRRCSRRPPRRLRRLGGGERRSRLGWDSLQAELPAAEAALSVAPLPEPNPLTKAVLAAAEGAQLTDVTQRAGRRWSVADAYLRGALRRPNHLTRRRGMLASNVAEAYALVRTRPELEAPDLELVFCPVLFQGQGLEPPTRHGFTIGVVALAPRSRGSVGLRSADPDAAPAIRLGFCTDPDDMRVLVEGLRLASRILARPRSRRGAGRSSARATRSSTRTRGATAHTLYHPVGTCRMGEVLDAELRVRVVAGLRVVDASAIPVIPGGHTNTPTVMLAQRAARLIRAAARTEALVAA